MPVDARPAAVTVRIDGVAVVVELSDLLDGRTGEALVAAAETALATDPERVDIDLRALQSWTQDGVVALVRCRAICGDLSDGLYYRTGRGPGRGSPPRGLHLAVCSRNDDGPLAQPPLT